MTRDEKVLALSWNIATEPKLFRELISNPYSFSTKQLIVKRFPKEKQIDVIKATILAEPEGRRTERIEQNEIINERLIAYCKENKSSLSKLSKGLAFSALSKATFKTDNSHEIEENYSQEQRRNFKLITVNYIENLHKPSLKILGAFFLILFIFFAKNTPKPQSTNIAGIQDEKGYPTRLIIPAINVNANIQHVGISEKGEMEVPSNTTDVGWFSFGPIPGEIGSAVIDGHFNGKNGTSGVFNNLKNIKMGDKLYIEDNEGMTKTFTVYEIRNFKPGYEEDVFGLNDKAYLNLVTCDGVWDVKKKSYSERLVIFTKIDI